MARRASPNSQVIKRSVTKDDFNQSPYQGYGGGIYQLTLPFVSAGSGDLPPYWSPIRDRVLKTSPMRESMWASAIGIATSKIASSDWNVDGRRIKYWHDLLLAADNNQSFVAFEEKQIRDFLLTDNGCHFEIIRTNDAAGARISGIQHLPSWRVIRTGDLEIPAIYRDRRGTWHEMKYYQIVSMADEPDADDIFFGTGHCAASRAWSAIMKLSALELYVYEKISGKRASRIYLVNANLNEKQLQTAMDASKERTNEKGYVMYEDAVIIPILDPAATASVAHIDLKGLPENFDADKERIHAMLTYANSIGIDPVELDPNLAARGRALGSGSQAQVLDDKQTGKGLVSYYKKKEYLYNEYILPDRVTFSFGNSDLVDRARVAAIFKLHVETVRSAVGGGQDLPIITPEQAKQVLVELGDIPPEFLTENNVTDETLRDTQKPDSLDVQQIKPVDAKLMLTEPKPEPAPFGGAKPAPKTKQSLIQYWTEKAYNDKVNKAEVWASQHLANWQILSETELMEVYSANQPAKAPVQVKESNTPAPMVVVPPASPVPPIHIYLPAQKEATPATPAAQTFNVYIPKQEPLDLSKVQLHTEMTVPLTVNAPITLKEAAHPDIVLQPSFSPNLTLPPTTVEFKPTIQVPAQPAPQVDIHIPKGTSEVMEIERDSDGLIARVYKETNYSKTE